MAQKHSFTRHLFRHFENAKHNTFYPFTNWAIASHSWKCQILHESASRIAPNSRRSFKYSSSNKGRCFFSGISHQKEKNSQEFDDKAESRHILMIIDELFEFQASKIIHASTSNSLLRCFLRKNAKFHFLRWKKSVENRKSFWRSSQKLLSFSFILLFIQLATFLNAFADWEK
jgi:hypothetical protein